jgi:S-DNA-T family DNA segregation ATPase FtsK/SpoIIIE
MGGEDEPTNAIPLPPRRSRKPRGGYEVPLEGVLDEYEEGQYWKVGEDTRNAAETLRVTLEEFGIQAEVTGIRKGPVITMFEILPAPGVKLSKIVNLADNIALRLAAASVRIVAPIPGKHAVGIEIPNAARAIVGFGELLKVDGFRHPRMEIPIALGKDIPGDAQIVDLTRMPHVLIAGATGSGKSVCVNSIICSVLYRRSPEEVKLILIDPKIVELKFYNHIPHLLTPVVTDPKRAFQALQYCIYEMERRYTLLDALQVRDVQSYNRKIKSKKLATEPLPYIVVVVDEFADLMATSGKELESTLARLAAMSRAVGIHLVLATQRPSTDVITGLIKSNIPSRIAFMVASKIDSRIILDSMGAEKLLGRGDMLFTSAWDPFPLRIQGAFLSEEEVERVVAHVKQLGEPDYIDDEIFLEEDDDDYVQGELEDPLMEKAIDIVTTANKASASYLQRRLKVGYNRAARMVEEMERLGIVGPQQGSKPREIIGR